MTSRDATVPAAALRGLLAGTCTALLLSVVAVAPEGRAPWTSLLVGAALVAWVTLSPGSPAPTVLLLLSVVVVLDAGPAPLPLLVLAGACLSAVHLLAALCALAPSEARWELDALRPVLRRWLLAQGLCLPLAVLLWLDPAGGGLGLDVAAGLLALALVAGLVALSRRRGAVAARDGAAPGRGQVTDSTR